MEIQSKSDSNKMSLFAAILVNINIMVGAGIYTNPPMMAAKAGGLSFLGWALSSLIFLPLVFCISKASKLFPGEGSFYTYVKGGLGETSGFLAGWGYFLTYVSTMAFQTFCFRELFLKTVNIPTFNSHPILFNILFFLSIYILSLLTLKIISNIQSFLTIGKLLPIIIMFAFLLFLLLKGKLFNFTNLHSADFSILDLQYTIPFTIFGFFGFESCCSISHLIKDGEKNASRSILIGFFATVLIYTMFNYGLIQTMGAENLASSGTNEFITFLGITTPLLLQLFGIIITTSIFMSLSGAIYGEVNAIGFILHSMAKQKIIFAPTLLSKINRNARPYIAFFVQLFLAFSLLTLINQKVILMAVTNLGFIFTQLLVAISIFIIFMRKKSYKDSIAPIFAVLSCTILGYYSWLEIGTPLNVIPFIVLLLIGLISFKFQTKKECPLRKVMPPHGA